MFTLRVMLVVVCAILACAATSTTALQAEFPAGGSTGTRSLKGFFLGKFAHAAGYYHQAQPPAAPGPPAPPPAPPVTSPRPGIFGLKQDIHEALRCQLVYSSQYGGDPNRLRAALGPACQEATLNPIQCCTDSVKLLNSPDLYGCICNNIVYNQLCSQLNVAGQTCETLLPTLKACGLQCPQ